MINRELLNFLEIVKYNQIERRIRLDELILSDRYIPPAVIVKLMDEIRWHDKYIRYQLDNLNLDK